MSFDRKVDLKAMEAAASNPLERLFYAHEGNLVHKWHHYLEVYDKHFGRLRDKPISLLEVGVSQGGSLHLWRDYLAAGSTIVGIDKNRNCARFDGDGVAVRIGSQSDPDFLDTLLAEFGPFDVVIDDGSHVGADQRATFEHLWPRLPERCIYVVEDLHTSYWAAYGGGYRSDGGFMEFAKSLIDSMHGWYSREPHFKADAFTTSLHEIAFYDSMVVLVKRPIERPYRVRVGEKSI